MITRTILTMVLSALAVCSALAGEPTATDSGKAKRQTLSKAEVSYHFEMHSRVNEAFFQALGSLAASEDIQVSPADTGWVAVRFCLYRFGRMSHVAVVSPVSHQVRKTVMLAMSVLRRDMRFQREYRNQEYVQLFYLPPVSGAQVENPYPYPSETAVYANPEQPALPQGGEAGLMAYLADNLNYPKEGMEQHQQGRISVSFVVDDQGRVRYACTEAGEVGSLEYEALRLVSGIPVMQPARQDGQAVWSAWKVPVVFQLTR